MEDVEELTLFKDIVGVILTIEEQEDQEEDAEDQDSLEAVVTGQRRGTSPVPAAAMTYAIAITWSSSSRTSSRSRPT